MSSKDNHSNGLGELTTFHEMLTSHDRNKRFDEIIIPKIQRDYAQGRSGRSLMRSRFLKRLFSAIDPDSPKEIKLDFVYGQVKNNMYFPIDGQQRLTTLFLLYLYVGKRSGVDVTAFSGFTYDTRDSSKEFCKMLIDIPASEYAGIKKYIENQWWFTSRWNSDPTISSMMVMLDDIDSHYRDWSNERLQQVWVRLTEKNQIKFWNLRLDDLETSDDLYIKMNSRGKPLTNFEQFKAEIESYLYDKEDEAQKKKASEFSLKIDTVWTNLLWKYRDVSADSNTSCYTDNGLDTMFINIFKHFIVIEGTKLFGGYKNLEETHILTLSENVLKGRAELLLDRFSKIMDFFEGLGDVHVFFSEVLTNYCDEYRIKSGITAEPQNYRVYLQQRLDGAPDFFYRAAKQSELNFAEMLMLEAFFQYAYRNTAFKSIDFPYLREKIRIVRNLIVNSRDELRNERMQALLLRIDKIINGEFLDDRASGEFRQAQVSQEIAKDAFIASHPEDEWLVKFAENHSILCGNLACYMGEQGEIFTRLLHRHEELFHADADYDRIEKYLLTFGDYGPMINGRKLYGGRLWWNWRDDIFTNRNKISTPILHQALNSEHSLDDATVDSAIIEWLDRRADAKEYSLAFYLAKYKGMRYGEWARYAMANDFVSYDIIMMNKINFNGKHWNPYLFCVYKELEGRGASLGDYNAPLIFEKEEVEVRGNETGYELKLKDGTIIPLKVPQTERNGKMVDEVDRIDLCVIKLKKLLDQIAQKKESSEAKRDDIS